MMIKEQKLNLGSGQFKKEGYVNVDSDSSAKPDMHFDINDREWPFKDNAFSKVEADHLLEHLDDPFQAMREIHRISKHNSEITIRVPHFSRGFTHPEHKSGFDVSFPLYFNPSFLGGYQGADFTCKSIKLHWFAQPYLKRQVLGKWKFRLGNLAGKVIDFLSNMSPHLCSRMWCNWVGGFEEIEFQFRTVKKKDDVRLFMGCTTMQRGVSG